MAICTTTQIPPPQHLVPPTPPVSVYLHRNVHESMEMNQTVQAVSVVPKDVLLLVRIATNLSILAQLCVATSTVLLVIQNNVHVDQPGVLLMLAFIVLNLPIPVHYVLLQPVLV